MNARFILTPERLLWIAIGAVLAAYAALTCWIGALGLTYPYQLDYGEGIVLWFAQEIARGHSIYDRALMASSNYPPLAMLLPELLMPIFGDGYAAGRFLNFSAAIVVAALIFRIVATETRGGRFGLIAALFFFDSSYIYHWAPLYRADLLGLGFTFTGIYFAWKYCRPPMAADREIKTLCLAGLCFLLGLYTKQTLVAAPAAVFIALFQREKKTAIAFALALGATGGAIYVALDWVTHSGFTFGLIDSNATVFLPEQLAALVWNFATTHAVLVGLGGWEWVRRLRTGQVGVLEVYAATVLATLVFAGRVGAWENYFFEAIAIVCVLASAKLKALSEKSNYQLLIALLLLVQLALYFPNHDPRIAANLVTQGLPANQQLGSLLVRTNGIVISEDMGALATSGKPVVYYTFQYSSLARAGKWDQSWELNGLRDGTFPLVVLEQGTRQDVDHYRRFTREFVSGLDRYYTRTLALGQYEIYTPAPPLTIQSGIFGDVITLVGWSADNKILQPGYWNVQLVWQAQRKIPSSYTAFVHLETADGGKVAQDDQVPLAGKYPTSNWAVGEMVRDAYTLSVPGNMAAGKYLVRVGWYNAVTGERLPVAGSADDSIALAAFEVR